MIEEADLHTLRSLPGLDESQLPPRVRTRLSELRACGNVERVTVLQITGAGVLALLFPKDMVAEGGGWAMPNEPVALTIPASIYAH